MGRGVKELEQIMAFNGVGMAFGSCSRVVFGVAIVLVLCNVSTSAPKASASSEVTTWSEELQFARPEGNAQFLPSGVCLVSLLFQFKYVLFHILWKSDDVFTMVLGDGQDCKLRSVM